MKKITSVLVVMLLTALLATGVSAKTVLKGDLNMDGKITASDARTALRVAARLETVDDDELLIADITEDGKITASDARIILRRAASLEQDLGNVEIEDPSDPDNTTSSSDNETTTDAPVTKTELNSGIGKTYEEFVAKFGEMRKVGTTDGTAKYTNDYITILSDPKMIKDGKISSIIISGGEYTLNGVFAGMSSNDAVTTLKADKWTLQEETSKIIILSKNAMLTELTVADGIVTKVEYRFAQSLLPPEEPTTEEPTTEEPTTEEPTTEEPTTEEPTTEEPTTEEPSTEEPSTEEPSTNPSPDEDISFENLPEQIKAFINSEFSLEGFRYDKDKKTPISITLANGNAKASMSDQMNDGSTLNMEMLVLNSNNNAKIYLINSDIMKYCEIDWIWQKVLGINVDSLDLGFTQIDTSKIKITTSETIIGSDKHIVYHIVTDLETCDIYMLGDDIVRIINYDTIGNIKSQMDITSLETNVKPSDVSLNGYSKGSMATVLGMPEDFFEELIKDVIGGIFGN